MAGAEIIATAMAILLLVVVSYVLVGCIITSGEITASAQKDYTLLKESQLRTAIDIPHSSPAFSCGDNSWMLWKWKNCTFTFNINNTGSETIGDFGHMDVYVNTSEDIIRGSSPWDVLIHKNTTRYYKFDPTKISIGGDEPSGNWSYIQISPAIIHPNMLDPSEKMQIKINNFYYFIRLFWEGFPSPPYPAHYSITVVTSNGVTDTYYQ